MYVNKCRFTFLSSITLAVLSSVAASAEAQIRQFDIPRQQVVTAIPEFALQAELQIIAPASDLDEIFSPELKGSFEIREGLQILIRDTGLEVASDEGTVITLRRNRSTDVANSPPAGALSAATTQEPPPERQRESTEVQTPPREPEETEEVLHRMTVTGTRIRGADHPSPRLLISNEEMRLAGHADLGEVARAIPQNFSGGQNPGVTQGATGGGFANQNVTGASSFNLRGLGPDATLTLLNGARLPYDGFFQATDVAIVPIAAIDRLEVVVDGASAIYGSDAVGGVANIILRRDMDGATLSARGGTSTSGGHSQAQFTGVAGRTWRTGSFLMAAEASRTTSIRADDRSFLDHMPNPDAKIYPDIEQKGVLFSAHQQIGEGAEISLDAFYTERRMDAFDEQTPLTFEDNTKSTIWGLSPSVTFDLAGDWSLMAHGFHGQNERDGDFELLLMPIELALIQSSTCYCNEASSFGLEFEGPLFELPGGSARMSVGAGYRKNSFSQINLIQDTTFISGKRTSRYGFAEIHLPMVSNDQEISGIEKLALTGAVRYEDYGSGDFGDVTTPKLGVIWGITPDLDFRASWGKSFKTPTLVQQNQDLNIVVSPAFQFGVQDPADAIVLRTLGGNPNLGPERAEILTAGLVVRSRNYPGLSLELSGFNIDYTDRVTTPITPFTAALINPAFAEFVILNPSLAEQQAAIQAAQQFFNQQDYDPDKVVALIFNNNANVASQRVKGVDLMLSYFTDVAGGRLHSNTGATWMDSKRRLTPQSPQLDTSGTVYFPADFRARSSLSWLRDGFEIAGHVNFIDGATNTNVSPNTSGGSMTTFDAVIGYRTEWTQTATTHFRLAVSNLFDRNPPFLEPALPFFVNYDSTNYSPIGRVISLTVELEF